MMTRHLLSMVAGVVVIPVGLVRPPVLADGQEGKVDLSQLRPAVKAALEECAHGGTIKEIDRETRYGKTIYEADVVIDGKEVEFRFDEDGELLGRGTDEDEDDEHGDHDCWGNRGGIRQTSLEMSAQQGE